MDASVVRPGPGPLCLAGPTACGKSAVALVLAERHGGEIVSVDSMQVYRGLDIGTAKPEAAQRAVTPHHLIDQVPLADSFDAARWLELARREVEAIRARGHLPILCGGTGLYFRAWFRGLDAGVAPDLAQRAALETTPLADLLAELQAGDPAAFARVDRSNPRRVVRAIERLRERGPGGAFADEQPPAQDEWVIALRRSSEDLRRRIEERVETMFAAGLVEETRGLLERGLETNRTALQALGYRQVVEHLRGLRDRSATVALIKTKTWQFARRQMSWFRHQLRVLWVDVAATESAVSVAERVWRAYVRIAERPDSGPGSGAKEQGFPVGR